MIELKNLTVTYQDEPALSDVSLTIREKAITGIIGPNGAGKSTLIKGMMDLVKKNSGVTTVNNQPLNNVRKNIAYVEQRNTIDLTFPIKVSETVLLGTFPKLGLFHRPKEKEKQKVIESLKQVKMEEFGNRQIGELSGGQLQRVFIARALAQEADIIFLDEPFVGIDMNSEKVIIDLLKKLRDEGKTIVVVHHDLSKVTTYFDDLIILNQELISYGPISKSFTTANIKAAYGDSMGDLMIKGVND
ncbi:iron/zinc/copper transport system ATP-binding protein [Carnobacterium iners]|uniref:Iron/zinc/copper transport system ATP-binding protein n=1 Tax=Carnobacterium iners TaxID=1073423 RepID=A0A1X7MQ06_9LACT|nr:metal ABC transporter ATP-binding protein [Carnobacterium iners]SEK85690.1 iron/zinc/copper transport system ATP-binding protein [Carnobacterium iners]SMH26775.1 iron/zinc/copper transport system ATP-binding protein [Carnobacterium iners]